MSYEIFSKLEAILVVLSLCFLEHKWNLGLVDHPVSLYNSPSVFAAFEHCHALCVSLIQRSVIRIDPMH